MPAQMYLVITLRKPVSDPDQGQQLFDLVKQRLQDRPDIDITGHVTNHFDLEQTPPP